MKVFKLGYLKEKEFDDFLEELNKYDEDHDWHIIVDSRGGINYNENIVRSILNNRVKQNKKVTMYLAYAASSAFTLLLNLDKAIEINVLNDCLAMAHVSRINIDIGCNEKSIYQHDGNYDSYLKQSNLINTKRQNDLYGSYMTPKEFKLYKQNKDVFFDEERIREILKTRK